MGIINPLTGNGLHITTSKGKLSQVSVVAIWSSGNEDVNAEFG
jgi:hypothetical protein